MGRSRNGIEAIAAKKLLPHPCCMVAGQRIVGQHPPHNPSSKEISPHEERRFCWPRAKCGAGPDRAISVAPGTRLRESLNKRTGLAAKELAAARHLRTSQNSSPDGLQSRLDQAHQGGGVQAQRPDAQPAAYRVRRFPRSRDSGQHCRKGAEARHSHTPTIPMPTPMRKMRGLGASKQKHSFGMEPKSPKARNRHSNNEVISS